MTRHTIRSLNNGGAIPTSGDIAYLNGSGLSPQEWGKVYRRVRSSKWYVEAKQEMGVGRFSEDGDFRFLFPFVLHFAICRSVADYSLAIGDVFSRLDPARMPSWFGEITPKLQRHLLEHFALTEGVDPLAIVPNLPYAGFGYIIADDHMAHDACNVFKLFRLGQIKQLSFLHDPVLRAHTRSVGSLMFEHTRYCHVLDVYATAGLIAERANLSDSERNLFMTAAITHDALTPAGGDSVKLVDPEALDEDLNYRELLKGGLWEGYKSRWGIDQELLVATVKGEGKLGALLDVADKSSYIARDVHSYLGSSVSENLYVDPHYATTRNVVEEDRHICALWESLDCINGQVVFADEDKLKRFLLLRALMFRGLYYNPFSRFFEYLFGRAVVKHLYTTGQVTREELLRETDWWLEQKIDEFFGVQFALRRFHDLSRSRIEEHHDLESAKRRAREFDNDTSVLTIVDDFNPKTGPGTKRFHVKRGKKPVPFCDAFPDQSDEISRIISMPTGTRLFFFEADDLKIPTERRSIIKSILR